MDIKASDYIKTTGGLGGGYTSTQNITTSTDSILTWSTYAPCDTTLNNIVVNLPKAVVGANRQLVCIKKTDNSNNFVKIQGFGGTETIDGKSFIYLYNKDDSIEIMCSGTGTSVTTNNRNSIGSSNSYLYAERIVGQTSNIAVGNQIIFTNAKKQMGSNILVNTSTGIVTLRANSSYSIKTNLGIAYGSSTIVEYYLESSTDGSTWLQTGTVGVIAGTAYSYNYGRESTAHCTIDTSTTTYIRVTIKTISGVSSIGYVGYGFPWIEVEEVNRQDNVVNSVDSMFCYKTSNQTGVVIGTVLTWDKMVGNMITNGNTILLKAGKTYEIITNAMVSMIQSANNPEVGFLITNSGTSLSDQSICHSVSALNTNNDASSGTGYCKITPSTDIYIDMRCMSSLNLSSANIRSDGTWMKITQIGSSACTGVDTSLITGGAWKTYTPTIIATAINPNVNGCSIQGLYRVVGKTLQIKYYRLGSASSTNVGTGDYAFSIPSGYTIDTSILPICTSNGLTVPIPFMQCGLGGFRWSSQGGNIVAFVSSNTSIKLHVWIPGTGTGFTGSSFLAINSNTFALYADVEVPIV